jgi:hypothetical protein
VSCEDGICVPEGQEKSTSVPYGEVVHIECQYGSKRINRTLYCSYKGNGMYSLQGDSAECPGQYIIIIQAHLHVTIQR